MKPNRIYKFKSLDNEINCKYVEDILQNFRLFAPNKLLVNDPFEGFGCKFFVHVAGAGYHELAGVEHPIILEKYDRIRFISFSTEIRNPVLWAHYASNYSGVCFEFSTDSSFRDLQKVNYNDDRPIRIGEEELIENEDSVLRKSLLVKSTHWSYENEWRLFTQSANAFLPFNKEDLISLIVGPNFNFHDHRKILNIANRRGVLLRKAQPISAIRRIEFLPLNYKYPWGNGPLYPEVMFTDI